ncbi:hypothetical protein V6Z77_001663, partial [Aspergillus fumigatus]
SLFDDLERCISTLANLKKVIEPRTTQKPMKIFGLRALKWPLKRAEVDASINDIRRYRSLFSLALQVDELGFTTHIDHSISLSRLRTAKGAAFNSYENQHDECLLGTRTKLLSDIEKWAISPQGKCIFWLNGMAGTGKSTISRTVAHRLKENGPLRASFFFKKGEKDRGSAKSLFPINDNHTRSDPYRAKHAG